MGEITGSLYKNITETDLIKQGAGKVHGLIVNSHTSGTIKLIDGLSSGVAASGVLTSSGAMVAASHAVTVFTSDATAFADGETVTLNTTVYTFKTALTGAAYEVLIGADAATSLDNLKAAVNGTGVLGTTYGFGTLPHPEIVAYTNTDTAQTFIARLPGVTANTYPTTETCGHASFPDTTLGGGTGASDAGVTTAAATVTIGVNTYTIVDELSETYGATSVANQVKKGAAEANMLDNLKSAINRTGTPGVDYSSATIQHPQVYATTNTNTAQTVVSRTVGTSGNSIATTETLANTAWGAATLASGTLTEGKPITGTITFSAVATTGERFIPLYDAQFNTGLLAVVGGTAADVTVFYN